ALGAELLAQDRSARIARLEHAAHRLLGGAVGLGDGRAVGLGLDAHAPEARQDLGARRVGGALGEGGQAGELALTVGAAVLGHGARQGIIALRRRSPCPPPLPARWPSASASPPTSA